MSLPGRKRWDTRRGSKRCGPTISAMRKYGGKPPRVELGATFVPPASDGDEMRGQVRFWVRDNGRGLTPEQQGKLFAQFERLEQTRVTGHGLGLSIVRRIVEKLGGQVGVESQLGQGSTFYFTLPAMASTLDDLRQRDGG
jgi:two-component system sensor histidine kinase/response regulator